MSAPLILYHFCKGKSMYDPVLRFKKSAAADVVKYVVGWTLNGSPAAIADVLRNSAKDVSGYSVKFSDHNSGVALVDGDVVGVSVKAVDSIGLESAAIVATDVTIPSEPPTEPVDVVLSLT
jgi:hypothetical protein